MFMNTKMFANTNIVHEFKKYLQLLEKFAVSKNVREFKKVHAFIKTCINENMFTNSTNVQELKNSS